MNYTSSLNTKNLGWYILQWITNCIIFSVPEECAYLSKEHKTLMCRSAFQVCSSMYMLNFGVFLFVCFFVVFLLFFLGGGGGGGGI